MRPKIYHAICVKSISQISKILILLDIRSMENVGSLMRTADAAGIDKVYLSGITPAPIDRFGRPVKAVAKTALGAEISISWEKIDNAKPLIEDLKRNGFQIISIEQDTNAKDYKNIQVNDGVVFILGNELNGIPKDILEMSDDIAQIPMKGKKESLNVSVAGGVAIFRMLDI